jgi:glycosyltransferase involved in cell wall biosynthesis
VSAVRKGTRLLYANFEAMSPDRAAFTHVQGLVGGLEKCGWSVHLIAAREDRARGRDVARQLLRYLRITLRAISALPRADALYVRGHFAAWPLAQCARFLRLPIFHEINGIPEDVIVTYPAMRPIRSLLLWFYKSQFRRASHLFAVTSGLADHMKTFSGHSRVSVAPNGVDPALFRHWDAPRPPTAPAEDYALFYGDLAQWHGLELMLSASRDSAWPRNLVLLMIGRGSAAASVAIPPDLIGRVIWMDRMAHDHLPPFIIHAQLGLVPITDPSGRSRTGVLPLKLIEMMACGIPVIVTDLPEQANLVRENGCGIVVPIDDPHALALAVAEIADSSNGPDMGRRGRAAVETAHNWEVIAKKVSEILSQAVASRTRRRAARVKGAATPPRQAP